MKFYTRSYPNSLCGQYRTLDEALNDPWVQANWLYYRPEIVSGLPLKNWEEALQFNDYDEAINGGPASILMLEEFSINCRILEDLIFRKKPISATKVRWYERENELDSWKLIEQRILKPEHIGT